MYIKVSYCVSYQYKKYQGRNCERNKVYSKFPKGFLLILHGTISEKRIHVRPKQYYTVNVVHVGIARPIN